MLKFFAHRLLFWIEVHILIIGRHFWVMDCLLPAVCSKRKIKKNKNQIENFFPVLILGHHWKKAKKLMEPAFRYSALRSFVPVIQEKTDVLIDLLEKEAGKSVFPFCEYIKNCTFDIATSKKIRSNFFWKLSGEKKIFNFFFRGIGKHRTERSSTRFRNFKKCG